MKTYTIKNQINTPDTVSSHIIYNEVINQTWTLDSGYFSITNYRLLFIQESMDTLIPLKSIMMIDHQNNQLIITLASTQITLICDFPSHTLEIEKSIFNQLLNEEN